MLRILFLAVIALAVVAIFTRSPRARRVLWALFGLLAVYAALKATGVIEAIAPARDGVS